MTLRRSWWGVAWVVALFVTACGSARGDRWLSDDKARHFQASAGLSALGVVGSGLVVDDPLARFGVGVLGAVAIGGAKELSDLSGNGQASGRDMAFNVAGAVVGGALTLLFESIASD